MRNDNTMPDKQQPLADDNGAARQPALVVRSWLAAPWPVLTLILAAVVALGCGSVRRSVPLTKPAVSAADEEVARHTWQRPDWIVAQMQVLPGSRVVDLGAGNGYLLPWLARAVGPTGTVYALEIQPELIGELKARCARDGLANVVVLASSATEVALPEQVDRAILLHSYRELSDPVALLSSLKAALKATGRVFVVDFLPPPDPQGLPLPLPPEGHRVAPETIEAEARGAGLVATQHFLGLPHQSFAMFLPAEQLEPAHGPERPF